MPPATTLGCRSKCWYRLRQRSVETLSLPLAIQERRQEIYLCKRRNPQLSIAWWQTKLHKYLCTIVPYNICLNAVLVRCLRSLLSKRNAPKQNIAMNDIADIHSISRGLAYKLANSGSFKASRIGNIIRLSRKSFENC